MDIKHYLAALLVCDLAFSQVYFGEEIEVSDSTETSSWQNASINCIEKYSSLMKIDNYVVMHEVEDKLNGMEENTFWIGGREIRGEWIWSHGYRPLLQSSVGCFSGDMQHHVYTNFTSNQPELCAGFCKSMMRRQFAVLQGEKCFCLYDTTSFVTEDSTKCDKPCPGNPYAICGGSNAVTFYTTQDVVNWGLNEPSGFGLGKDCAYVMKSTDNNFLWYSGDCSQTYHFICKLENQEVCSWMSLPFPCFYELPEARTWLEASRKCQLLGGYLAGNELKGKNNLTLNGNHWTGLTRRKQIWIDGSRVDMKLKRYETTFEIDQLCIALQYQKTEGWGLVALPCNRSMQYICSSAIPAEQRVISEDKRRNNNSNKHGDDVENNIWFIAIPVLCGFGIVLAVLIAVALIRKRYHPKQKAEPEEHFYFILEKQQSVYNNILIDVDDGSNRSRKNNTYNKLVFNGTVQQSICDGMTLSATDLNKANEKSHNYDKISIGNKTYDTVFSVRRCKFSIEGNYDKVVVANMKLNEPNMHKLDWR